MSSKQPLFLGLDVGTQSLRAALFDPSGNCRAFATGPLDTTHPQPGWAEQHPLQWWQAARKAVPEALARAGAKPEEVAGIGLDCTACTVLPSRSDGTPLGRALLWMDQRAFREAEEISATRDPSLRYVSGVVSPEWMLPKALWLKRHEPALYARAEQLIECTDWFMFRLTGQWTLSLNHVTVKWNYDPLTLPSPPAAGGEGRVRGRDGGWSAALLSQVGMDDLPAKWPARVIPLGKGDLRLSEVAARELGLRPGIPVAQ